MVDATQKLIDNAQNFTAGRQGNTIKGIVLHTEAARKIEGMADRSLFNWFNTNSRGVSAHYYVTFSGKIEQYVLDHDTAHQAGNWNVNLQTIGIEHQDNGFFRPGEQKYTKKQYEASAQLVAYLCQKYGIPIAHVADISTAPGITIHNQVPFAATSCPGGLDWQRIIDGAAAIVDAGEGIETAVAESVDFPLRGLHGDGAAEWMLNNSVRDRRRERLSPAGALGREFRNLEHGSGGNAVERARR